MPAHTLPKHLTRAQHRMKHVVWCLLGYITYAVHLCNASLIVKKWTSNKKHVYLYLDTGLFGTQAHRDPGPGTRGSGPGDLDPGARTWGLGPGTRTQGPRPSDSDDPGDPDVSPAHPASGRPGGGLGGQKGVRFGSTRYTVCTIWSDPDVSKGGTLWIYSLHHMYDLGRSRRPGWIPG